jgi:DivIVA domain-containing protein
MPTSDLDMPLLPSAEQIRRREFATVRRGYDPQQVRMYLTSIAEQVETLERELSEVRLEADAAEARWQSAPEPATKAEATATAEPAATATPAAEPTSDPYEALSKRFAHLIELTDQEASRTIDDARREAERTLEEARAEADRIRVDAQGHAEQARQEGADLLERARVESDRVLSGLDERRAALMTRLQDMRTSLLAAADELAEPLADVGNDALVLTAAADEAPADEAATDDQPAASDDAPVDPRYEALWISSDAFDLPDLTSIDLDFDEKE